MKGRTLNALENTLQHAATRVRMDEARARRELDAMGDKTKPRAIILATLADLHAKAAVVYEDAIHVLEMTTADAERARENGWLGADKRELEDIDNQAEDEADNRRRGMGDDQ